VALSADMWIPTSGRRGGLKSETKGRGKTMKKGKGSTLHNDRVFWIIAKRKNTTKKRGKKR